MNPVHANPRRRILFAYSMLLLLSVGLALLMDRASQSHRSGASLATAHRSSDDGIGDATIEIPIVSLRRQPLAAHEEALPPRAQVRLGSTRFRHPNELSGGEIIAGRFLLTIRDQQVILTDLTTGQRTHRLETGFDRTAQPTPLLSPDGHWLLIKNHADIGRLVARVWEVQSDPEKPLRPAAYIQVPESDEYVLFHRTVFSDDCKELYVWNRSGFYVFNTADGLPLRRARTEGKQIKDVATAGKRFLTTDYVHPGPEVEIIFGLDPALPVYRFKAPDPVPAKSDRFEGSRRASGKGTIEPFELVVRETTGRIVNTISVARWTHDFVSHLNLSPDGRYVSVDAAGGLQVWNVDRQEFVMSVKPPEGKEFGKTGFTPDSKRFFATFYSPTGSFLNDLKNSMKGIRRQFDLATGKEVESAPAPEKSRLTDHGVIRRHDAATQRELPLPPGYAGVVMDVSRDGKFIAVGDLTGRLDVWGTDGDFIANLRPGGARILSIAFSPDGKRLASSDRNRVVRFWSTADWREAYSFNVPADHEELCPEQITFSPSGRHLLINSGEIMAVWDIDGKSWIWDQAGIEFGKRLPVAFSGDAQIAFTRGDNNSRWLDAGTGKVLRALEHKSGWGEGDTVVVNALAISPDGRILATLLNRKEIQLCDAATGNLVRGFHANKEMTFDIPVLRFSPDGRWLASANEREAFIWETATGTLAQTLEYPDGAIHDLHFGGDSRTLITSNHREVIVWSLKPLELPMPAGGHKELWDELGAELAVTAERAHWLLLDYPAETIQLLRAKVRPAEPLNSGEIKGWIAKLDAAAYRERVQAASALRAMGRRVLGPLREARINAAIAIRDSVAHLVRELEAGLTAGERRHIRAVEALELIGTSEAWALIEEWAGGAAGSVLTEEAGKAITRKRMVKAN